MVGRLASRPGPDSPVAAHLADTRGSLSGLERTLDRFYSTEDVRGRARAVARMSEVVAFVTLSQEYDREMARLERQSSAQAIACLRSKYGRLSREIRTLYQMIPHGEIEHASGRELNSILLADSVDKLVVLRRYLGLAAEDDAEAYPKNVVETLIEFVNGPTFRTKTAATLYTEMGALTGLVHHLEGERLSDLLNGMSDIARRGSSRFLEFSDGADGNPAGCVHPILPARINTESIRLVTLSNGNAARGAGASEDRRSSSYVLKRRMPVELRTTEYCLVGDIHCRLEQTPEDVFNENAGFLSLTDVSVRPLNEDFEFSIPYVAVNKQVVHSLTEASISSGLSDSGGIDDGVSPEPQALLRTSSLT
jgi:hypothetical protein